MTKEFKETCAPADRPVMPKAQIIYGDTVYWLCVLSALVCMVGPVVALAFPDANVIDPRHLFGAIWEGKDALEVWRVRGSEFPGGHFWMDHLAFGDGLTQFGLFLGGVCAAPALVLSSISYMTDPKNRHPLWAVLGLWVVFLIALSASGLVGMGH
ncbi:hypothetical protein [Desulfohalovibrio reitneri]|uniref:hypothetical protein n=1 Tax=Desulfohalovibrio reitneri TaxID=1307759 RepID=UPI0004A74D9B|nr:hypothetical protein [Desulfohalovibrio reitneri]